MLAGVTGTNPFVLWSSQTLTLSETADRLVKEQQLLSHSPSPMPTSFGTLHTGPPGREGMWRVRKSVLSTLLLQLSLDPHYSHTSRSSRTALQFAGRIYSCQKKKKSVSAERAEEPRLWCKPAAGDGEHSLGRPVGIKRVHTAPALPGGGHGQDHHPTLRTGNGRTGSRSRSGTPRATIQEAAEAVCETISLCPRQCWAFSEGNRRATWEQSGNSRDQGAWDQEQAS